MVKKTESKTSKSGKSKKKINSKKPKKEIKKTKPSSSRIKNPFKKKIPEKHFFVLVTGEKLRNIKELADALGKIDETHYKHHVNEFKNDFANWIQDIFEEFDLAEKIKTAKNKEYARLIIYKHICNTFW